MRTIATTVTLVALLLLTSLVLALVDVDQGATLAWQGALIVLGVGAVAFLARFVPDGPWGTGHVDGNVFDDPQTFWGRTARFYREG